MADKKVSIRYRLIVWVIIVLFVQFTLPAQDVYLNEIIVSNSNTILDEYGDAEDWIEIYYAGSEPLNLLGYGLSDNYERPFRWVFPDVTMQPGEFLLVWASGKNRTDPGRRTRQRAIRMYSIRSRFLMTVVSTVKDGSSFR